MDRRTLLKTVVASLFYHLVPKVVRSPLERLNKDTETVGPSPLEDVAKWVLSIDAATVEDYSVAIIFRKDNDGVAVLEASCVLPKRDDCFVVPEGVWELGNIDPDHLARIKKVLNQGTDCPFEVCITFPCEAEFGGSMVFYRQEA